MKKKPNNVLIVDLISSGHHPFLASRLSQYFSRDAQVTIICRDKLLLETALEEEFGQGAVPQIEIIEHKFFNPSILKNRILRKLILLRLWKLVSHQIQRISKICKREFDKVFLMQLDLFLSPARYPFIQKYCRFENQYLKYGMCLSPLKFDESSFSIVKTFVSENNIKVFSFDQDFVESCNSAYFHCLPEPYNLSLPEQIGDILVKVKSSQKGRKVFVIIGYLCSRKSIGEILEYCAHAKGQAVDDYLFVIAGELNWYEFSKEHQLLIKQVMSSMAPNVLIFPGRIRSERTINELINYSDGLVALYQDFEESSGLVLKAAAFKSPIITLSRGLIYQWVEKYDLGISIDDLNPKSLASGFAQLAKFQYKDVKKVEAFVALSNPSNFAKQLDSVFFDPYDLTTSGA